MAFDNWTQLYSALLLLVSSVGNIDAQSCGGTYTTDNGVFMSPNYPDVYDLNVECTYTISLSTIGSITLNFETFDLDRSADDYVSITCGSNSSFVERNYTWSSKLLPLSIPWCSSGRLFFYSDSYHNYTTRGFRIQYQVSTKDCGDTAMNLYSSSISSPNYPQNYNNNENCTYSIGGEFGSYTFNFQTFNLESDCQRDWVQIICDNGSYISPKYCGSTLPRPVNITNCIRVLMWFHTDNSSVSSGFSLQYSYTPNGCGKETFTGLSGIITSPNYPRGYVGYSCNYYIYPVSSIALDFQSFDLEPFNNSTLGDYVQIACLPDTRNTGLYFRGDTLPPLISFTQCSRVSILLSTDWTLSGTGFNLRYRVNPLVAHSAITSAPQNLTVAVGNRVQLDCTSDAIGYFPSWTLSRDGTEENTTVIASFCDVNSDYTSQYDALKGSSGVCNLVITNATLAEAGVYTCVDVGLSSIRSVVTIVGMPPFRTRKSGCGGTYTAAYGEFKSPNYPDVYPLNVDCIYRIAPSTMGSIALSFETFELDRSAGDYILITCESNTSYVPQNFSWNANTPPISMPSCSIVQLHFHSDSSHSYLTKGFRVQYQVYTKDCGNTAFTSSSGTISSPKYPQVYNSNENCTYSIWAPETSSFTLNFEVLDLYTSSSCYQDWVQIRCDNDSYTMPKYCGAPLPPPFYITNCSKVLVWFRTDAGYEDTGFRLQYSFAPDGCGKTTYADLSGIITSPNYPNKYTIHACSYYLNAVSSVALAFESFDLEPFIDIENGDYVQVLCDYDTDNGSRQDAYTYRGNTLPPLIICTRCYSVIISFGINNVISGTGFSLRYQVNSIVAHSVITTAPESITVTVGSQVQLDCTSDATDYFPSWTMSRDGTDKDTIVIASYCQYTFGDDSKYSVVKGGPGVCSLVISNAILADAGVYTCIDVGLTSSSSVVTVMALHDDNQK